MLLALVGIDTLYKILHLSSTIERDGLLVQFPASADSALHRRSFLARSGSVRLVDLLLGQTFLVFVQHSCC